MTNEGSEVDTVKQKAAEIDVDSFRQELGPFVVAAETTRMAMVFTNAKAPGNPIIFANELSYPHEIQPGRSAGT
jgi:hypothetical protein